MSKLLEEYSTCPATLRAIREEMVASQPGFLTDKSQRPSYEQAIYHHLTRLEKNVLEG